MKQRIKVSEAAAILGRNNSLEIDIPITSFQNFLRIISVRRLHNVNNRTSDSKNHR